MPERVENQPQTAARRLHRAICPKIYCGLYRPEEILAPGRQSFASGSLDYPFAGSRMLRDLLRGEGVVIGRERVTSMMWRMGIVAIYRRPNTSKPGPGHKIYPYLLRGVVVERAN